MHSGFAKLTAGLILAAVAASIFTFLNELPIIVLLNFADARVLVALVILSGLALAGYGVWQQFGPPPKPIQVARANAALIYGAMISLAGVDNPRTELNIDEVQMIQRCHQQFFQRNISAADIRKAHARSISSKFADFGFGGAEVKATPEARVWAYKAAMLVANADGDISPAENARLRQLAHLFDLSEPAVSQARQEADQLYAKLKSAIA
jgi:hypothetical protein